MYMQSCTLQLDDRIKNWFTYNFMVIVIVNDVVDVIASNWQKKSFTYFFAYILERCFTPKLIKFKV